MKLISHRLLGGLFLLLALFLGVVSLMPLKTHPPATAEHDAPFQINRLDPDQIYEIVDHGIGDDAVGREERHLPHQSIHLALGLDTGQFGPDPGHEYALRKVAEQLINAFLVKGDRLTLFGYEMAVGKHNAWEGDEVASSDWLKVEDVWNNLHGGEGGQDLNEAIRTALTQTQPDPKGSNLIVLLLSHWKNNQLPANATQKPHWTNLSSDDLKQFGFVRRDPEEIRYVYEQNGKRDDRSVWATMVVPTTFEASLLSGGDRATLLQKQLQTPLVKTQSSGVVDSSAPPESDHPQPLYFLIFLAVLCLGSAIYCFTRPPEPKQLDVKIDAFGHTGQQGFSGPWKNNELICRLVGPQMDRPLAKDIVLGMGQKIGPVVLAEIRRQGRGILVKSDLLTVSSEQGIASGGCLVAPGRTVQIRLSGDTPSLNSGGPEVPVAFEMEVTLK